MNKFILAVALTLASTLAVAQSFEAVDIDQDGAISMEEAAVIEDLDFAAVDENQDGSLSLEEYTAATEPAK